MIVRVEFFGIVVEGKKRKKMRDHVDIHFGSVKPVKAMFLAWVKQSPGIRGDSGIFHPSRNNGSIEVISVEQVFLD